MAKVNSVVKLRAHTLSLNSASGSIDMDMESFLSSEKRYQEELKAIVKMVVDLKNPTSKEENKSLPTPDDATYIVEFSSILENIINPITSATEILIDRLQVNVDIDEDNLQDTSQPDWPDILFELGPLRSLSTYRLFIEKYEWFQDFIRAKNVLPKDLSKQLDLPLRRLQDYYRTVHHVISTNPNGENIELFREIEGILKKVYIQASQELSKEGFRRDLIEFGLRFQRFVPIYNPNRRLLRRDCIEFKSQETQRMESVLGVLLNDAIMICTSPVSSEPSLGLSDEKLSLLSVIKFKGCAVPEMISNVELKIEYSKTPNSSKEKSVYYLKFEDTPVCSIWLFQLQNCIQACHVENILESRDWQVMNTAIKSTFSRADRSMSRFIDLDVVKSLNTSASMQVPSTKDASSRSASLEPRYSNFKGNRTAARATPKSIPKHFDFNCPLCLRKRNGNESENICSEW